MPNYLTISSAIFTYQQKSDISNYLTTTTVNSTYQSKSDMSSYVNAFNDMTISGIITFSKVPRNASPLIAPTLDLQFIYKFFGRC